MHNTYIQHLVYLLFTFSQAYTYPQVVPAH